ncbi:solute carrier family 52, riboflavin transporter, member 3-B [Folsomia candida]|uniref:Riboflavin transporter n=1 Tax=Folsomia candida TaxID=158441 RepID=A0A226D3K2_FOLCA|nr:solute carrier family 52, riboflavin transporter, member 3-B [Folsomia candida]OXA39799.1 Riboflavin transporter 2 [Folsomia candida]
MAHRINAPDPPSPTTKPKRVYHIDILATFFGIGTWLTINGLFVQLPLLALALPEGWNIGSYLSVMVQLANVGPLSYIFLNSMAPNIVTEKRAIYVVMLIGLVTTVLLANLWEETTPVGGVERSTALLILVTCLALVDCSSRVLYLPFMSKFQEIYLTSYFLGEGLSGLVPSAVALIQGVGGDSACQNRTDGQPGLEPAQTHPRFSVDVFFYILFTLVLGSLVAFVLMNKKEVTKNARKVSKSVLEEEFDIEAPPENLKMPQPYDHPSHESKRLSMIEIMSRGSRGSVETCKSTHEKSIPLPTLSETQEEKEEAPPTGCTPLSVLLRQPKTSFLYLLMLQGYICFWEFGAFPSIQSFSGTPYGNVPYHLAVALSNMINPVVCVVALFVPVWSFKLALGAAGASVFFTGWICYLALESPSPPLVGSMAGEVMIIAVWIIVIALFTYVRLSVATLLFESNGKSGLLWCGAVTQGGSLIGAIISFALINNSPIFRPFLPCGE